MQLKRCNPCQGSGKMMGGGMITKDCHHCQGKGKIDDIVVEKSSKHYKRAKENIKKLDTNLSDQEAENMLDEALKEHT